MVNGNYKIQLGEEADRQEVNRLLWKALAVTSKMEDFKSPIWLEPGHSRSLLMKDNGKIIANLTICSFESAIRGYAIPFGGIAEVATAPTHRRQGLVRALHAAAFQNMKDNGEVLSILGPFDVAFYEKFGFATAEEWRQHSFQAENLRTVQPSPSIAVRELRSTEEAPKLLELTRSMTRFGSIVFPRLQDLEEAITSHNAFIFEENGEPVGWTKFHFRLDSNKQWTMIVSILSAWKTDEVLLALVHLIKNYGAQCLGSLIWNCFPQVPVRPFLKDRFKAQTKFQGEYMVRIVDFSNYCELIQIPERASAEIIIQIQDKMCPWNNGTYLLQPQEGNLVVEETDQTPDVVLNALRLSRVVGGLTTPTTLRTVGQVDCSKETAEKLETIFPRENLMILNRF
ncbi:MAG: enhanced intracellular survival protein Eis [Candidatus Heimdallarchaeota archaeon]